MKVAFLRDLCGTEGVDTSGARSELVSRLCALQPAPAQQPPLGASAGSKRRRGESLDDQAHNKTMHRSHTTAVARAFDTATGKLHISHHISHLHFQLFLFIVIVVVVVVGINLTTRERSPGPPLLKGCSTAASGPWRRRRAGWEPVGGVRRDRLPGSENSQPDGRQERADRQPHRQHQARGGGAAAGAGGVGCRP